MHICSGVLADCEVSGWHARANDPCSITATSDSKCVAQRLLQAGLLSTVLLPQCAHKQLKVITTVSVAKPATAATPPVTRSEQRDPALWPSSLTGGMST